MGSIFYLPEELAKIWTGRGSNPCRYTWFLSSPKLSDRLWGPPTFVLFTIFCQGNTASGDRSWSFTKILCWS